MRVFGQHAPFRPGSGRLRRGVGVADARAKMQKAKATRDALKITHKLGLVRRERRSPLNPSVQASTSLRIAYGSDLVVCSIGRPHEVDWRFAVGRGPKSGGTIAPKSAPKLALTTRIPTKSGATGAIFGEGAGLRRRELSTSASQQ